MHWIWVKEMLLYQSWVCIYD